MIKLILLLSVSLLLTSCLRTRGDIGFKRPGYNQPQTSQSKAYDPNSGYNVPKQTAPTSVINTKPQAYGSSLNSKDVARLQINLQEINDQIRSLHGRLDVVERKVAESSQTDGVSVDAKLKNYELALSNLEAQVRALQGSSGASTTSPRNNNITNTVELNAFGRGEQAFRGKNWRKAISEYQLYREQYPKGNDYSEATYKIGVCFQELKMKSEAKVFYQEAVSKYPSSKAGKKANFRLKQL